MRTGRGTRRVVAAAAVCVPLAMSGCSSVTREPGAVSSRSPRSAGSTAGAAAVDAAAASGAGPAESAATASGATASSGRSASSAGAPGSSVAAAAGGGPAAALPCAQPLKIGVSYSSDEGAAFSAVGHPQNATGFASYAQALKDGYQLGVDQLNREGGLAGCKVALAFHDFSAFAADGQSGESQKECTDFAEDQHVFGVVAGLAGVLENRVLIECLAQHHVPVFWNGINYTPAAADYTSHRGYLYQIAGLALERLQPAIPILAQAGYFGRGSKVGIIVADNGTGNNQRLVKDLWKPELAAMHIPVSEFTYTQIDSFQQAGGTSSQFASAVLQFKGAGVNHVIFTPDGGDGLIFFTAAAESQGYRPRYAITTGSVPAGMSDAAPAQGEGALAVSWQVSDLLNLNAPPSSFPAVPSSAGRAKCDQVYGKYAAAHNAPVASFYAWCDALAVMQTALAGRPAAVAMLLAGIESLASFDAANTWAPARFARSHYDGGTAVRVLRWDTKTSQWGLGSQPQQVA